MKFRSTTAAAALVIGAMTIGMTSAHADATTEPAGISYSTKLVDQKVEDKDVKTVVSTLKNGTFELAEKDGATAEDPKQTFVNVKDVAGATVISFPLAFEIAGVEVPVKSDIKDDGKVLEVVPEKPANFQPGPVAVKPIASAMENQRAMSNFSTQFALATGIGTFVGTALGAIIGCVVTIVCVPGLVAGAGIGGIIGTIVVGGPTLIAAGVELLQTLQAADGTSKWAN